MTTTTMTPLAAVRAVLDLLDEVGVTDLTELQIQHPGERGNKHRDPVFKIKFDHRLELERFAAADGNAKIREVRHGSPANAGFHEWYAIYDRPGRRMLAQFYAFPFSSEWPAGGGDRA